MSNQRPIDKTKKSNHRCINCIHWAEKRPYHAVTCFDPQFYCPVGKRDMDYWNCCKQFEWNPNKLYKQEETHE